MHREQSVCEHACVRVRVHVCACVWELPKAINFCCQKNVEKSTDSIILYITFLHLFLEKKNPKKRRIRSFSLLFSKLF